MDKTAQTELHRLFLIERLPEPLTRASSHVQIFDNYIEGTHLRLRHIRDPYSNTWTRIIQKRFQAGVGETRLSEIHLDEGEYSYFAQFEGREIRKNRYFHEFDRVSLTFDVYLGALWGLCTAKADFETREIMSGFVPPPFVVFEVTSDEFFEGRNLVSSSFADAQAEVAQMGRAEPPALAGGDQAG